MTSSFSAGEIDWQQTRVTKRLAPTASGALRLARAHGDRLVCVRHRLTADGQHRVTTVELVVAVDPVRRQGQVGDADELVALRLDFRDRAHRSALQGLGARWDARTQLWYAPRRHALALGLADRIVRPAPAL